LDKEDSFVRQDKLDEPYDELHPDAKAELAEAIEPEEWNQSTPEEKEDILDEEDSFQHDFEEKEYDELHPDVKQELDKDEANEDDGWVIPKKERRTDVQTIDDDEYTAGYREDLYGEEIEHQQDKPEISQKDWDEDLAGLKDEYATEDDADDEEEYLKDLMEEDEEEVKATEDAAGGDVPDEDEYNDPQFGSTRPKQTSAEEDTSDYEVDVDEYLKTGEPVQKIPEDKRADEGDEESGKGDPEPWEEDDPSIHYDEDGNVVDPDQEVSYEAEEDENVCAGCGHLEDYLNDDDLCDECEMEAGIDRKESERDAYEAKASEISRPITDKESMLMFDKPWDELTQDEKLEMHRILADEAETDDDVEWDEKTQNWKGKTEAGKTYLRETETDIETSDDGTDRNTVMFPDIDQVDTDDTGINVNNRYGYDDPDAPEFNTESWDRRITFNTKVEAFESLGLNQGDSLKLAELNWRDLSIEVRGALNEVTEDEKKQKRKDTQDAFNNEGAGDGADQPDTKIKNLDEIDYNIIGDNPLGVEKYECEHCNSGFKSNEALMIHFNDLHAPAREFLLDVPNVCTLCDREIPSDISMDEHMAYDHGISLDAKVENGIVTDGFEKHRGEDFGGKDWGRALTMKKLNDMEESEEGGQGSGPHASLPEQAGRDPSLQYDPFAPDPDPIGDPSTAKLTEVKKKKIKGTEVIATETIHTCEICGSGYDDEGDLGEHQLVTHFDNNMDAFHTYLDATEVKATEDGGYANFGDKPKENSWSVLTVGSDLWFFNSEQEARDYVKNFPEGTYQIDPPKAGEAYAREYQVMCEHCGNSFDLQPDLKCEYCGKVNDIYADAFESKPWKPHVYKATEAVSYEADFKEDEHPREESGKFTSGGGGGTKQKEKPKPTKNLNKAKDKILKNMGEPKDDYDRNKYNMVKNLDGYPQHSSQLRSVGVRHKVPIMKSHLQDTYPESKWSVRTEYFSMGSSIRAAWTGGGPYPYGADSIRQLYSDSGATDIQVDYFDVDNYVDLYDNRKDKPEFDHGQHIYKDREERFSDWARIHLDQKGEYEASNTWSKKIAEDFTKNDVTGYQGISDDVLKGLKELYGKFQDQEKKEGGAAEPKEVPKSTSPASYMKPTTQQRADEPHEFPIDPETGEDLPVSSYNPNAAKYRKPDPEDTKKDVTKAYGLMKGQKGTKDEQPWQKGGEGHWVSSEQEVEDWWDTSNDFYLRTRANASPEAISILDSMGDDVVYRELSSADKDKAKQLYQTIGESYASEDYIPEPYKKHFDWVASMDQDDYVCKHCGQMMMNRDGTNALHTAPVSEIIEVVKQHLSTHGITESYATEDFEIDLDKVKSEIGVWKIQEQVDGNWNDVEYGGISAKYIGKDGADTDARTHEAGTGNPTRVIHTEAMYGYGSATGRMSPRDAWEQGATSEGGLNPVFREFRTLHWSELPADIQELWKSELEYLTTGEAKANEYKQYSSPRDWWNNAEQGDKASELNAYFGLTGQKSTDSGIYMDSYDGLNQSDKSLVDEIYNRGWSTKGEAKANEDFQPERQGKRVKLLTGDHAGKTGTIASVSIFSDGFHVRVDGVHNEYEMGVPMSPNDVEFLGGESKANESVTSWWGGIGDTDFRSKVLNKINADYDYVNNDYWELPQDIQDEIYIIYSEGFTGESLANERDIGWDNKRIMDQSWDIMAEQEFGKRVEDLTDAQYQWIEDLMEDYGNTMNPADKPSSEANSKHTGAHTKVYDAIKDKKDVETPWALANWIVHDKGMEKKATERYTVQVKDSGGSITWQETYDNKEEAESIRKRLEADVGYPVSILDSDYLGEACNVCGGDHSPATHGDSKATEEEVPWDMSEGDRARLELRSQDSKDFVTEDDPDFETDPDYQGFVGGKKKESSQYTQQGIYDAMADPDYDKLEGDEEYMPEPWDYNEWYFGNHWDSDMSQGSKELQLDQQHVDKIWANTKWLDIPADVRKKITYVGYGG